MNCVDAFVILDSVQFAKRSYTNRCPIESPNAEPAWLTVPVLSGGRYHQAIGDVEVNGDDWREPLCERMRHRWGSLLFGKDLVARAADIVRNSGPRLGDLNLNLIELVRDTLGITTPLHFESQFGLAADIDPTERIVHLTKALGGAVYVSGKGGAAYLNHDLTSAAGIDVVVASFAVAPTDELAVRFGDKSCFELLSRTGGDDCRARLGSTHIAT